MSNKEKTSINLKYPVKNGNDIVTELIATRPKGKHLKKMPVGYFDNPDAKLEGIVPFICSWLGITTQVFDELDAEDVMVVMETMGDFLGASLKTGKI
jgi:hypothetical protein